jgi:hypothetical protein
MASGIRGLELVDTEKKHELNVMREMAGQTLDPSAKAGESRPQVVACIPPCYPWPSAELHHSFSRGSPGPSVRTC